MTDVSFLLRKRTKLYRQVGNLGLSSPRSNALFLAVLLRAVSADAGSEDGASCCIARECVHRLAPRAYIEHRSGASLPPDGRRRACLPIV
jgi:hypothetical protein